MITENGISGNAPRLQSLDFAALRERGLQYIQELSGDVWTDFNLHDPGVTLLEILCYAITDAGYRTEQIKEAFFSDERIDASYIEKYLFSAKELLPSLPITKLDIENYITNEHEEVIAAWITPFPVMNQYETIHGGYEVSVFLKDDAAYDNLNSDVVEILMEEKKVRIQFMLFDEDNNRFPWSTIDKVRACRIATTSDKPFFQFEKYNGQLLLELEVRSETKKTYETIPIKARVAITGIESPLSKNTSISQFKDILLDLVKGEVFIKAVHTRLKKEQYKETILNDIQKSLLAVRNLCEDFVTFKVVNVQEIKMNVQVLLEEDAPHNQIITQRIFKRLDSFMLSLVQKRKESSDPQEKNVLYASNIIEELGSIEGVKAVQIENLNLFVDGIPTISWKEEGSFDCLHLQNFARYAPKLSREKSAITLVRHGVHHMFRLSQVAAPFTPKSIGSLFLKPEEKTLPMAGKLSEDFFKDIRNYESIQQEFPQNYRLNSGKPLRKAPEHIKKQQKRFKSYLLFYDRLLLEYTERLFQMSSHLGFKPSEELYGTSIDTLIKDQLPDIKALDLIQETDRVPAKMPEEEMQQQLSQRNQVLDHLLARFGVAYLHLEDQSLPTESHVKAKIRLLKAIPVITRERGLGLSLLQKSKTKIWESQLLSGLQKRLYRLLGVNESAFQHKKLSLTSGKEGQGFYLIEHFLLMSRPENHVYEKKLNHASILLIDYLKDLNISSEASFNHSFEMTLLIPNWYKEWSGSKERYEAIIKKEVPVHIMPHIHWISRKSLKGFEILYEDWLKALFQTYN